MLAGMQRAAIQKSFVQIGKDMAQEHQESPDAALGRANAHRMQAVQAGYFDKLAQYGYVPETPEQAERWLNLANVAETRKIAADRNNGHVLDKLAHELCAQEGELAPEARQAQEVAAVEALDKVAAFAENAEVASDLLHAQLIERQQQQ